MRLSKRKPEGEAANDPVAIRTAALRLLARREHSTRELTAKLLARGFAPAPVSGVVAALAAENLLSDARFVEEFIASRLRHGAGPAKIREELRGRGVDSGRVDAGLAEQESAWLTRAEAVRRKRFGAALPQNYTERARQARFLQQRGFTAEQIRQVLKGDIEDL